MVDQELEKSVPAVQILINGNPLPVEAQTDLFHAVVDENLDAIGMFSFSLNAGDSNTGAVKWVDDGLFKEGNEIRVKLGYHAPLQELMVGEITALEPEFSGRGSIVFTVRGYNRLYKLGFGRKSRSFRNMKDSDIAAQIAQDWSLTAQADDTTVSHEYLFQNNQTDLEFLLERARRIHYEVKVEGRTLFFRKPRETAGKTLTLTFGENLLSFFPRLNVLGQTGEVAVRSWNAKEKKEIQGKAQAGDETPLPSGRDTGTQTLGTLLGKTTQVLLMDTSPATLEDAEIVAKGRLNASAFEFMTGEGTALGEPQIRAGIVIELKELGKRFSGTYYVTEVSHVYSSLNGYTTAFTVRRSAA